MRLKIDEINDLFNVGKIYASLDDKHKELAYDILIAIKTENDREESTCSLQEK